MLPPLPGSANTASDPTYAPDAVGAQWIRVFRQGHHWHDWVYVNWHTGETAYDEDQDAHLAPDLNAAKVMSRLCSPLRRRRADLQYSLEYGPRYLEYGYERPFGLTGHVGGADRYDADRVELDGCGTSHRSVLARCGQGCSSIQLGGGLASWVNLKDGRAVVASLRATRRFRWKHPTHGVAVHTRHLLFLGRAYGPGQVKMVKIPR